MKKINDAEIANISGGVMCNCVAKSQWSTRDGGGLGAVGYGYGAVATVGLVTYANVCKDMIGNISSTLPGVSMQYVGCYPQAEEGMRDYLSGNYK